MSTGINDLPNEVLQLVLRYLLPESIFAFQLVCRRFSKLIDPVTWRYFCQAHFRYWNPQHQFLKKLRAPVEETDWKEIYAQRCLVDKSTTETLNSILSTQVGRIEKVQHIIEYGYDAKDCLLRHSHVSEDAEDVLARRYYSNTILGCVHRNMAIEEWTKLQNMEQVSLERALAAFDMFVLHDRIGDFQEITQTLDQVASSVRTAVPNFDDKTKRQKALAIAQHLRANNLVGCREDLDYHDLDNVFLGVALHADQPSSLPLISDAIFCCVAQRLDVDAALCNYPFHCLVVVRTLNSETTAETPDSQNNLSMYLDPFNSASEIESADLISRLEQMRIARSTFAACLSPRPVQEFVLRHSRNILNSVQRAHESALVRQTVAGDRYSTSDPSPDLDGSYYGALWASVLLQRPGPSAAQNPQRMYLPHIIECYEVHFPTDVSLIEKFILPLFAQTGDYAQLRESVRVTRSVDSLPKEIKNRTPETSKRVSFKVGQVFTHKRYNYQGVVTGWDVECGAGEAWMSQMRVNELSRGRQQSFYHVLVEDKSVRYVAEENIEPIYPDHPGKLMHLAGRHFKRWDNSMRQFISNIRDEYPND